MAAYPQLQLEAKRKIKNKKDGRTNVCEKNRKMQNCIDVVRAVRGDLCPTRAKMVH